MKIDYCDEKDFKHEQIEISDEMFQIANDIHSQFGNYGPIVLKSDKKTLSFGINKGQSRMEREIGTRLYMVTISPLFDQEDVRDIKIKYIL